jgi:hypothetical protein
MSDSYKPATYKAVGPVVLTEEQILALHRRLRDMRHDVNGKLANIAAAAELIRLRPDTTAERIKVLLEQPHQAAEAIGNFSRDFEAALGLRLDS